MPVTKVVLDSCLSRRYVGALDALYGDRGYKFMALESIVDTRTDDEIWANVYKRFNGHVVLSGDSKIASKPHQALAFMDNGFISFFPGAFWGDINLRQQAALLVYWWPFIEEKIKTADKGTCWRILGEGRKDNIRLRPPQLKKVEIPDGVIQEARKKRAN